MPSSFVRRGSVENTYSTNAKAVAEPKGWSPLSASVGREIHEEPSPDSLWRENRAERIALENKCFSEGQQSFATTNTTMLVFSGRFFRSTFTKYKAITRHHKNMNFIFISPHFPHTYWEFCNRLKSNGVTVLAIAH